MKNEKLNSRRVKVKTVLSVILVSLASGIFAQDTIANKNTDIQKLSWRYVATKMPKDWYGTPEAAGVAETILFVQKDAGGWEKNKPYQHQFTDAEKAEIKKNSGESGATIDNGATTTEMIFLANMYSQKKDQRYWKAFEKGFNYLLEAQYKNGGWPQFYPLRKGYYTHITYNDNAMVNVLQLLKDVVEGKQPIAEMPVTASMKQDAKKAFDKGIDCILNTQIKVNGKPTVWCAQHDEETLLPAKARAYELPSFSGAESMNIVLLLMSIKDPSPKIVDAVKGAMTWMNEHKLTGIKVVNMAAAGEKRNMVVVEDKNATPLLARFYDLETGKPFFCDRDGIKKSSLAEIGDERRNGYSWYSGGFEELQKKYEEWLKKLK